jgi:hypothetical protein
MQPTWLVRADPASLHAVSYCTKRIALLATALRFNVRSLWKQSWVRVSSAGHVRLRGQVAKRWRYLFPPYFLSSSGVAPLAMTVRG